jgi:hypothetical protein
MCAAGIFEGLRLAVLDNSGTEFKIGLLNVVTKFMQECELLATPGH